MTQNNKPLCDTEVNQVVNSDAELPLSSPESNAVDIGSDSDSTVNQCEYTEFDKALQQIKQDILEETKDLVRYEIIPDTPKIRIETQRLLFVLLGASMVMTQTLPE